MAALSTIFTVAKVVLSTKCTYMYGIHSRGSYLGIWTGSIQLPGSSSRTCPISIVVACTKSPVNVVMLPPIHPIGIKVHSAICPINIGDLPTNNLRAIVVLLLRRAIDIAV